MKYEVQIVDQNEGPDARHWIGVNAESPQEGARIALETAKNHGWGGPGYRARVYPEGTGSTIGIEHLAEVLSE